MTGDIFGVPFKIKIDSYLPDKIVDLKIMRDFEPIYVEGKGRVSFIEAWGYDIQAGVYQEIVRQNTGKQLPLHCGGYQRNGRSRYSDNQHGTVRA